MGNAWQVWFAPESRFRIDVDEKRPVWPGQKPEQFETEPRLSYRGIVKIGRAVNQHVELVPVADDSSSERQGNEYLQSGFQKIF
jgi:hypothetical protein